MVRRLLGRSFLYLSLSLVSVPSFAQQFSPQPLITQPIDESQLTTLKGNTHPLAQPQFDIGIAASNLPLQRMLLVLKRSPQQDFALRKLLDDQQDKASANYHKWLTPDEFGLQFGPSDQDVQLVTGWLQSHGFEINRVAHGRSVIEFSGVEAQVEAALHTQIRKYLVNGEEHWANASDPQIPAALAPAVVGVWSLHDFRKKPKVHIFPQLLRTKYSPGIPPNTTFNTSQGVLHALGPADFAKIYNLGSVNNNPAGLPKIAVVARSNFNFVDLQDFRSVFNLASPFYFQVFLDGPDPGDLGGAEEAEVVLDASWSGAVAPYAEIFVAVSASTNTTDGVDLSELYIIDNQAGDVMTESFGSCEAFASQSELSGQAALAQEAAAQGLTYVVSAGDTGAEGCDPNFAPVAQGPVSVNFLASSPYTVAVGGTMFKEGNQNSKYWSSSNAQGTLESALSYIPEIAWNESCTTTSCGASANILSGGGGASAFFAKPSWQMGVAGIPADGARDLPDVSFTAAVGHDPYLLCLQGSCIPDAQGFISFLGVGGTSVSAPAFAGVMALVDQATNSNQGQPNYVLYRLAANENFSQCNGSNTAILPAANCIFNDVTSGNNAVPGEVGYGTASAQYQTGVGYNLATGLGSINGANLVNNWKSVTFNASTTTLSPGSINSVHGTGVPITVTVTGNNNQTPTGSVALIENTGFITGQTGITSLNLVNGSVNANVSSLPGGSYGLFARYSGDGTFGSSSSFLSQVNISPEPSTTNLSLLDANGSPYASGPYGGFVYVRSDVSGKSGFGIPTGTVSFTDNSNFNLGPLSLNSRGNTATPNGYFAFSVGQHSLVANYQGDSSFNVSSSSPANFTITQASTTTTVTPSASGVVQGSAVTLTASVASPAFAGFFGTVSPFNGESQSWPGGTVTFYAGATQLGVAQQSGQQATANGYTSLFYLTTSSLPTGQNSITAQYSGDSNYLASSASPITVTVNADFAFSAGGPSITIPSPGGSGNLTLTINGQTGYGGTVNFTAASCAGLPFGAQCNFSPSSVSGSGSTVLTVSTAAPTFASRRYFGWTSVGLVFAGVFLLGIPRQRFHPAACAAVLLLAFTAASTGCGGGSGGGGGTHSPGTPLGSYAIIVTATSSNTVSHTVNFTLQVN